MHEKKPDKGHIDIKYALFSLTPVDTSKGLEGVTGQGPDK